MTRFVGDAVGVRSKAKGYGGKEMKKVRGLPVLPP